METSENCNKKKLFCRLCVAHEGKYTITPLKNHIKFCYNIQVQSNDGLSQVVCGQCRTIVREFSKLKQLYQARQSFLRRKRRISIIKSKQVTPSDTEQNATVPPPTAVKTSETVEPSSAAEPTTNLQAAVKIQPASKVEPESKVEPIAPVQPIAEVQLSLPEECPSVPIEEETPDKVTKCTPPTNTAGIAIKEDVKEESQQDKEPPSENDGLQLFEKYYNCKFCKRSFKNSQRFNMHLGDHRKMISTKDKLIHAECFIAMTKLPEVVPVPEDDDFVRISESKRVCKRMNPTYFVTFEIRSNKGKKLCETNNSTLNILDAWNTSVPAQKDIKSCKRIKRVKSIKNVDKEIVSVKDESLPDVQKEETIIPYTETIIQYPLLECHIGYGKTIESIVIDCFHKNEIETLAKLDDTKYRGLFLKNGRKISMEYSSWTLPLLRFFEYRHLYINWIGITKKFKAQKKTCIKVSRRSLEEEVVVDNLTNFVALDKATHDIMDNQLTEAERELILDRETILKLQESVSLSTKSNSLNAEQSVKSTMSPTVIKPKPANENIVGIKIKNAEILSSPMQKIQGAISPCTAKIAVKPAANKSNNISVIRLQTRENNYQDVSKNVYTPAPSTIKCVQEERLLNNPQLVNVESSYARVQPNKVSPVQKIVQNIPVSYYQNVSALPATVVTDTTTSCNNIVRSESHLQNYVHYQKEKPVTNYQSVLPSNKIEQKQQQPLTFHSKIVPHHGLPEKHVQSAHTNIVPIKRVANTAVSSKYNQYAINNMQQSQYNQSYNSAGTYHHSSQNLRNDHQNQMSRAILASNIPMQTNSTERNMQLKGMNLYQGNDMNALHNNAYNTQVHNSNVAMLNINSQSMVPSYNNHNLYNNIPQAGARIAVQGQTSNVPVITNKVMYTGETGYSNTNVSGYYYQNGNETVTNDNILYNNYPTNYEYG